MLTQAIILMAWVDFRALKYRQAKRKAPPLALKGERSFIIFFVNIR
jgi:hypothetical protein